MRRNARERQIRRGRQPETTVDPAERWRRPALDVVRRWTPGRRWLRSLPRSRNDTLRPFAVPAPSAEIWDGVSARARGRRDVPARLANLMDARRAPGDRKRPAPADAPARRHRRDGQTGPARHGSIAVPCPGPEWPTACSRLLSADPHGDAAGARIDQRLSAGALHGLARTLDPYVQGWLSRLLDLRIPAVRIHTGQAADATARRFNADAVSFGPDIMFRAGRFAPDSATGLGLLGHELTHVAHTQLDRSAALDRAALGRRSPRSRTKGACCSTRGKARAGGERRGGAAGGTIPRDACAPPRAASVDRGVAAPGDSDALSPSPELTRNSSARSRRRSIGT